MEAWWEGGNSQQQAKLLGALEEVLRQFGDVQRRSWGDVDSVELRSSDGTNFSFQVVRLCAAWDFGILPRQEPIQEIRRPLWRRAVDECRLLTSVAYHLLREWHRLPPLAYLGPVPAYIREDPSLEHV